MPGGQFFVGGINMKKRIMVSYEEEKLLALRA